MGQSQAQVRFAPWAEHRTTEVSREGCGEAIRTGVACDCLGSSELRASVLRLSG